MLRTMMKSKIHRATVTQADLHYVGSVTVDEDLLDAADLLPGELVHIVDVTNGARLETYTIAGERGSGVHRHQRRRRPAGAPRRRGDPDRLRPDGDRRGPGAPAARGLRRRRQQDRRHRLRPGRDASAAPAWSAATLTAGSIASRTVEPCPYAGSRPPDRARARLDDDRRRRRGRLRHRRPDRRAAAARPGRQGPGRHQGRARRRLDPVGAGRHRRRARPGRHPGRSTSATPSSPAPAPATRRPCGCWSPRAPRRSAS